MFVEHPITGLLFYRYFRFDFVGRRFPGWFVPDEENAVCIKRHTQTDVELLCIDSGRFFMEISGVGYEVEAGDLLIVNPGDPHSGTVSNRQSQAAYHCLKIGIDALEKQACEGLRTYASWLADGKMKVRNYLPRAEVDRLGLRVYLDGLLQNAPRRDPLSGIAAMGNLSLLCAVLFSPACLGCTPIQLPGEQKNRLFEGRVLEYLDRNWNQPVTSLDAAHALSYSQEYFCKIFKDVMGETFSSYLVKIKIHKAMELFQNGMAPGDVMNAVGMNNYSYFYRSFRKIYGVSPNKCRKKNK